MKVIRNKGASLLAFVDDYCVIDIETTGLDPMFDDVIEISALKVKNGKVVDRYSTLVYTDIDLDEFIVDLTGITNEMLKDAPQIEEVATGLMRFVGNDILLGHNVNFDINFLYDVYKELFDKELKNDFIDTLRLSRKILTEHKTHRLSYLKDVLQLNEQSSHRAESDCLSTHALYTMLRSECTIRQIDLNAKYYEVKAKDITADEGVCFDCDHILYDRICVFTGTLERMKRKDAMQSVVNLGGKCGDSVTVDTDYLIMGKQDFRKFKDGTESSKTKKAKKLINEGHSIQLISEHEFYQYLSI